MIMVNPRQWQQHNDAMSFNSMHTHLQSHIENIASVKYINTEIWNV